MLKTNQEINRGLPGWSYQGSSKFSVTKQFKDENSLFWKISRLVDFKTHVTCCFPGVQFLRLQNSNACIVFKRQGALKTAEHQNLTIGPNVSKRSLKTFVFVITNLSFFLFFPLRFLGWLYDQSGSYNLSLVVQCAVCLFLVVTLGTEDILNNLRALIRNRRHAKI